MTTSASRPLNSTEPVFSYAAAASGKHTAGSQNKSQSTTSSKSATSPMPQTQISVSTSTPSVNGTTAPTTGTSTPHSVSVGDSNSKITTDGSSVQNVSTPSSPSLRATLTNTLLKEDDAIMTPLSISDERTGAWDKHSQTSSHAEHKSATTAGSRTPDAKASELVPAAPPKVNPWKHRLDELAKTKVNASVLSTGTPEVKVSAVTTSSKPVSSEKQVEQKQVEKKKRQNSGNWEGMEKEKINDNDSVSGDKKDGQLRDRKKSTDAGRVNDYAGKEDGAASSRNARPGKKGPQDKEQTAPPPPPPVTDTSSWPTPETAQDEAERVKKEREEKEKERSTSSGVKSGVSKWVPVPITTPYVPPFSSKSGRGRSSRGGREGGRGGTNVPTQGGEKTAGAGSGSGAASEGDRTRPGPGTSSSRGGYQGGKGAKGPSNTNGSTQRRDSKVTVPGSPTEKRRDSVHTRDAMDSISSDQNTVGSTSTGMQTERQRRESKDAVRDDAAFVGQGEVRQYTEFQERHHPNGQAFHPRAERGSHQYYGNGRQDAGAEGATSHPRERGSDRGRGYRGRGGFYNTHYSNGHQNHAHHQNSPNSQYASASQNFHAHTNGQQYSAQHSQSQPRVYRGSSTRSQSVSNGIYRYMQQPPQYMQSYQIAYDYTMMAPGALVNPNEVVLQNVIGQINYYFSVDNLCKDMFLRKHMDNDGYVRLSVIACFNRLRNLTQDPTVIRDACLQSEDVQIVTGLDDWHIRKKVGWENWVLAENERDLSARCGESSWHIDPRRNRSLSVITPGAPVFVPSGSFPSLASNALGYATPLSANVPEFNPSATFANGLLPRVADYFLPDNEIEFLMVVTKKQGTLDNNPTSPESSPRRVLQNGESLGFRSMSPEEPLSPNSAPGHRSRKSQSEVGWFVSADAQKVQESQDVLVHKPYTHFRNQSLKQREVSGPGKTRDMVTLYKFWAHFLPKRFNGIMYNEFKTLSLQDAEVFARVGLEYLFQFYEEAIMMGQFSQELIRDFIALAKKDGKNGYATGPDKLKASLANPALNVHHRAMIEGLIDEELRSILDVAVEETNNDRLVESYLTVGT
ncbi:hypothetical protein RUND412_005030 [Rhizina undulata]